MVPGWAEKIATRSARYAASRTLWVTNRIVLRVSCQICLQLLVQDVARLRIKRRERLVHQQDLRVHRQRASDRHALAHASGELVHVSICEPREVYHAQEVKRAAAPLRTSHAHALQRKLDVLNDVEPWKEGGLLEDHATVRAGTRDVSPAHPDAAARRRLEAGDEVQQRRLAATRRANETDELAFGDREIDVAQSGARAAAVARRKRLRERRDLERSRHGFKFDT